MLELLSVYFFEQKTICYTIKSDLSRGSVNFFVDGSHTNATLQINKAIKGLVIEQQFSS